MTSYNFKDDKINQGEILSELKKITEELKNIKVRVENIDERGTNIHGALKLLHLSLESKNMDIKDIKDYIDSNNRVAADIYEAIAAKGIHDEEGRLNAVLKLAGGASDVSTVIENLHDFIKIILGPNA